MKFPSLETVYLDQNMSKYISQMRSFNSNINFIPTDKDDLTMLVKNMNVVKQTNSKKEDIFALNANGAIMWKFDLSKYKNARLLSLQRNGLCNLENLRGIENLKYLSFLNISTNMLCEIKMPALESLSLLSVIDVSNNHFKYIKDLGDLRLSKSLKHLYIFPQAGAEFGFDDVIDYMKETNIETIDGIPISPREKWFAINHDLNFESNEYSNFQLDMLMKNVTFVANLGFKMLISADFSKFNRIEKINLRNNSLKSLKGIDCLVNLTYIDVSGNPELNYDDVLEQLSKLRVLREVNLAYDCWSFSEEEIMNKTREEFFVENSPNYSIRNRRYRNHVLQRISFCLRLHTLDRIPILAEEILKESNTKFSNVIQLIHLTHLVEIDIDRIPGNTKALANYVNENAECISWYPFIDKIPNIRNLKNLQILDLGHCGLTTLKGIGIGECKEIHFLNISHNQINDKMKFIAGELSVLPKLVELYISNNPFMEEPHRKMLPKTISGILSNYDICRLLLITALKNIEIIDSEVTEIDLDLAQAILDSDNTKPILSYFNLDIPKDEIIAINIKSFNINEFPFNDYPSLKVILASGNCFDENSFKIDKKIKYLDISSNHFSSTLKLALLANNLEVSHFVFLNQLDAENNPIKLNRRKFLRHYFRLRIKEREAPRSQLMIQALQNIPLKIIDGERITLDEVLDIFELKLEEVSDEILCNIIPALCQYNIFETKSTSLSNYIYGTEGDFNNDVKIGDFRNFHLIELSERKILSNIKGINFKQIYLSLSSLTSEQLAKLV